MRAERGRDALMENKSNHVLVGGVVLALLVVTLGFIVWLAGFSGATDRPYDIFFKQSVDGLAKGSSVTFAGVPAGNVEEISLLPDSPEFVRVRIRVKEGVPILQGTTATIAGVGFTGVSQINLDGAVKGAPPIQEPGPYGAPVIPTKPGALGELLNSAPLLLERIGTLTERLSEVLSDKNQQSISGILANVDRLSGSLADRGPEIAATLAETRVAIRQAGVAAEQIGKLAASTNSMVESDVRPMMANLNRTVAAARSSAENLDGAITEARPGLKAFSTRTIPEVSQLVRDLTEMSEALTAVATRLDRSGAGGVLGGNKLPDYKPK
jgi:phospholipid/cholesterol/gamma-HCH transport system substrate-binding protein